MDKVIDKTHGFHYTIVDNYILEESNLKAMEQIVYIHLKKYASMSNQCFPGLPTLAKELNSHVNTVRTYLQSLEKKGYISIEQRFNDSNIYTLLPYPEYLEEQQTKEEITGVLRPGIGEVINTYQNNINPTYGSMERDKLVKWFEEFEENAEVIIKAIEIAVEQGARKMKFIDAILVDWRQQGIKTLEQAEAYTRQREEKRSTNKTESAEGTSKPAAYKPFEFED